MRSTAERAGVRRPPLATLLGANMVSLAGSQITLLAVPWFVLQATGSPARVGLVGAVEALGYVAAAFLGGPLVDRWGPKRASVAADLASGAAIALIPALHRTVGLAFWQVAALVFLSTFCSTPGATARQGLVPDLATLAGARLERVNAGYQTVRNLTQLVGPLLAGVLIAALGASTVLWLDTATFALSALLIATAVPPAPAREAAGMGYLADVTTGLRFLRRERVLRATGTIAALLNALGAAVFGVVLPVYAARTGGAVAFGLLAGGFGGGALVGAIGYGLLGPRLPRRATLVALLFLGGLAHAALLPLPPLALGVGALVLAGMALGPLNPLTITAFQERTPPELRGRVFGTLQAVSMAAAPAGLLGAGLFLEQLGLRPTLLVLAAAFLAVAIWARGNTALRDLDIPPTTLDGAEYEKAASTR